MSNLDSDSKPKPNPNLEIQEYALNTLCSISCLFSTFYKLDKNLLIKLFKFLSDELKQYKKDVKNEINPPILPKFLTSLLVNWD